MNQEPEEMPTGAIVALCALVLLVIFMVAGPPMCRSWNATHAQLDAYVARQDAWDKGCRDRGARVMNLGKGANPGTICVARDGRIIGSRD